VVTCSTVGYGDAAPVTSAGRIFAVGLMLVGIGAFGTVTSTLGIFIGRLRESTPRHVETNHERLVNIERQLSEIADKLRGDPENDSSREREPGD
jgi:voltage-gated potassium channel